MSPLGISFVEDAFVQDQQIVGKDVVPALLLPDIGRVGRAINQLIPVFVCSFGYALFCRFDDRVGVSSVPWIGGEVLCRAHKNC